MTREPREIIARIPKIPPGTEARKDDEVWVNGFSFWSPSGNRYTISQSKTGGWWSCSCPGGANRGRCKHLEQYDRRPMRADIIDDPALAERARKEMEEKREGERAKLKLAALLKQQEAALREAARVNGPIVPPPVPRTPGKPERWPMKRDYRVLREIDVEGTLYYPGDTLEVRDDPNDRTANANSRRAWIVELVERGILGPAGEPVEFKAALFSSTAVKTGAINVDGAYVAVRSTAVLGKYVYAGDTVQVRDSMSDPDVGREIRRMLTNGSLRRADQPSPTQRPMAKPQAPAPKPTTPAVPVARRLRRPDEV